jgi:hypothetical protein
MERSAMRDGRAALWESRITLSLHPGYETQPAE